MHLVLSWNSVLFWLLRRMANKRARRCGASRAPPRRAGSEGGARGGAGGRRLWRLGWAGDAALDRRRRALPLFGAEIADRRTRTARKSDRARERGKLVGGAGLPTALLRAVAAGEGVGTVRWGGREVLGVGMEEEAPDALVAAPSGLDDETQQQEVAATPAPEAEAPTPADVADETEQKKAQLTLEQEPEGEGEGEGDGRSIYGDTPPPMITVEREGSLAGPDDTAEELAAAAPVGDAPAAAAPASDGDGTTKQSLVYNVSLAYNKMLSLPNATFSQGGRPWWTPLVLPYGTIVLGALPLRPEGHLETLTQATVAANGFSRVRAVLTLNKPYELQPTYLNTPVSAEDWASKTVEQMIFPVEDFNRPTPEQLNEACVFLDKHMALKNTVYVHCKAGRGRSCAVVCCYLVHRGMAADKAMEFVKHRRPHVRLSPSHSRLPS